MGETRRAVYQTETDKNDLRNFLFLYSHISDLVCHEAIFEFEPQQILKAKTCPKTRKRKDVPALRIQTQVQKTKALPRRPSPRRLVEVLHIVVWKMVSPPGI